jgi:hypothetical protein
VKSSTGRMARLDSFPTIPERLSSIILMEARRWRLCFSAWYCPIPHIFY